MPHIDMKGIQAPGIAGLFQFRPETARPLSELAEVLLRGPSSLSRGERELIAARVSSLNDCQFCACSHAAFAAAQLPDGAAVVERVCSDPESAPISTKLKALLHIAERVQQSAQGVRPADVASARRAGASDLEIHDTVLIAAAFCMYNRYVDGLATMSPRDPEAYARMAEDLVARGYLRSVDNTPGHGRQPRNGAPAVYSGM